MKLCQYELSQWTPIYGTGKMPNWYRCHGYAHSECDYIRIGLVRLDSPLDPEDTLWKFDCLWCPPKIRSLIVELNNKIHSDKKYDLSTLEQGKQDVDNLIVRVNNLKYFI